jgi:hypothetical protein
MRRPWPILSLLQSINQSSGRICPHIVLCTPAQSAVFLQPRPRLTTVPYTSLPSPSLHNPRNPHTSPPSRTTPNLFTLAPSHINTGSIFPPNVCRAQTAKTADGPVSLFSHPLCLAHAVWSVCRPMHHKRRTVCVSCNHVCVCVCVFCVNWSSNAMQPIRNHLKHFHVEIGSKSPRPPRASTLAFAAAALP